MLQLLQTKRKPLVHLQVHRAQLHKIRLLMIRSPHWSLHSLNIGNSSSESTYWTQV